MQRTLIALAVCLGLCGCVTIGSVNKSVAKYEGQPVENAVARFGRPSLIQDRKDGSKMYAWEHTGNVMYPVPLTNDAGASKEHCRLMMKVAPDGTVMSTELHGVTLICAYYRG